MKRRQVWRYSCEFCKKSNCSGAAISKHEERCTLNPNRVCGMCRMLEHSQPDIQAIIATLPRPVVSKESDNGDTLGWSPGFEPSLYEARRVSGNCPACLLASMRQAKIPVPLFTEFDYTKECKAVWDKVNADDPAPWLDYRVDF